MARGLNSIAGTMSPPSTSVATFREDALLVAVSVPRRKFLVLFSVLWVCGWVLTVSVLALDILRHPDMDLERNALWLTFWVMAGAAVGFVLLWMAGGQREIVRVDGSGVHIERHAGPFRRTVKVDVFSIRSIGYRDSYTRGALDIAPVAKFWRGALGRVVIDTPRGIHAFGDALSDADAEQTAALIQARLAHIPIATPYRPIAPVTLPRRYATAAGATLVAAMLVWPAVTLPARLVLIDRAICFFDDSVPPTSPANVNGMRPGKRLYLVALDGVGADRLEAVAKQFRTRYRVPMEVVAADVAVDAYDSRRRQVNADTVLTAFERMYPNRDHVVIGVTDRDMYIPGFDWRYAFSYRSEGRLAVVSMARMERGCLGLFTASEDRQAARLRKMIGKNVGVLYYGLALSNDPRSLVYAYIGGPQELDVMSETF